MFIVLLVEAASLNVSQPATSSSAANLHFYSIVISPLLEENIPMEREKTSSPDPMAQAQS
jgi:hypothetical protein